MREASPPQPDTRAHPIGFERDLKVGIGGRFRVYRNSVVVKSVPGGGIPSYNLAIVGFRQRWRASYAFISKRPNSAPLRRRWRLTGVATRRTGWLVDQDGLEPHGHSEW